MNKLSCSLLIIVLISPILFSNVLANNDIIQQNTISSEQYGDAYRYNTHGWIYLHIEGDPYERGYQHGYLLADEIVDIIQRWKHIFPQHNSWKLDRYEAMKLFWRKYPQEYKEEIKGIAAGVADRGGKIDGFAVSYKDILTLNEMYELQTRYRTYAIFPQRLQYNWIRMARLKQKELSSYLDEVDSTQHLGKCSAFLATGDATVDGRIVASQATFGLLWKIGFWHNYISERFNLILDIKPTNGYRMLITTSPGLIWSDEDFNQNEAGMILMGTSLQIGPWSRFGDPVTVRARKAIQYSDSIDEMVDSLLKKNNGLYANDWLMGDTKTGEIASLELSLRHHSLTRKKNGVIWSCNNAKDDKVRWGLTSFYDLGIFGRFLWNDYIPSDRDIFFEEFSNQHYGDIDVEMVKRLMSTNPINLLSTDTKITDSELVDRFGLWAFMGKPGGEDFIASEHPMDKEMPGYTDLPGCGWTQIFAISKKNNHIVKDKGNIEDKNGIILWDFKVSIESMRDAIYSSPIVNDDILYSSSWSGNISAINIKSKNLLWKTNIGWSSSSSPLIHDNIVYVGSNDGLFALNKNTGKIIWKNNIGPVHTKPAFLNAQIFSGSADGKIYVHNSENGNLEWTYEIGTEIYSSPVINENVLYFGSNDGCLYALDVKDKNLLWTYKTGGPIVSTPFIDDNTLYFGSWDNNLYAIDIKTGNMEWRFTTGWGIDSSPTLSNNMIYFGSEDNNFYAVDAKDGSLKWTFNTNGGIQSSAVVYGDIVFFGSTDGNFYGLDAFNGSLVWRIAPDYFIEGVYNFRTTPFVSSPFADDGKIYVGSTNGKIYCFDAKTIEDDKDREDIQVPIDTWLFLIIPLLFVISITCLYLFRTGRKNS